jgi:AcrR family transcriptional regulator
MAKGAQRPPAGTRRPGGRSARVRKAVLRAALEELAALGYSAFSFQSVAQRAGVHKTTVYRRWENRDALLLDALLERATEWVPVPDTGSLRGDLLGLAAGVVASVTTPEMEAVIRTFVAEAPRESELAARGREFWTVRFEVDQQVVERAIARGELPEDTDPAFVIEAVLGPLYFRLLISGASLDMAFAERVVDFVLAGVRATSTSAALAQPTRPQNGAG